MRTLETIASTLRTGRAHPTLVMNALIELENAGGARRSTTSSGGWPASCERWASGRTRPGRWRGPGSRRPGPTSRATPRWRRPVVRPPRFHDLVLGRKVA
jgi:hypothetical protein